jgi:hypothetical protein
MQRHYSHVRMDARRKAVSGLDGSTPDLSSERDERALRNEDVIEMLSGLSPRIVAEQIKHSVGQFDTSPAALKELQAKGVPEPVILAMFHAKKEKPPDSIILAMVRAGSVLETQISSND